MVDSSSPIHPGAVALGWPVLLLVVVSYVSGLRYYFRPCGAAATACIHTVIGKDGQALCDLLPVLSSYVYFLEVQLLGGLAVSAQKPACLA